MYIIVDERSVVTGGYSSSFHREGISSAGIDPAEFRDWLSKVSETDVCAECQQRSEEENDDEQQPPPMGEDDGNFF